MARSVLDTQLFITVASLTTLCLAAAVTERETLADRLVASRIRVINAADAERRRLEHNLHDGAQQLLTGLMVRLGVVAERSREAPSETEGMIETARTELGVAIDELRELAHGNHPVVLTKDGLGAAIAHIARRSSVPVEVRVELPSARLGDAIEATAYYVAAESVANAQKYARANSIHLRVRLSTGALEVVVADDGVGGAVETPGSGLEGLRDRVEAFGGAFRLVSPPGGGTQIAATLPLASPT
jgi:signal transduction histidine kinase